MANFSIFPAACCGVAELHNISSVRDAAEVVDLVAAAVARGALSQKSYIFFTGVVGDRVRIYAEHHHADRSDDYGQALADYIVSEDLGTVTAVPPSVNHSGNTLQMWIWAPRWDRLAAKAAGQ